MTFLDEAIQLSDIVIMDQNLDYGTGSFKGTDFVEKLLKAGQLPWIDLHPLSE